MAECISQTGDDFYGLLRYDRDTTFVYLCGL